MKRILSLFVFSIGIHALAVGQGQIIMTQAGTGQLFYQVRGDSYRGSPFFNEKPLPAWVTLAYGKTVKQDSVVFDTHVNRLWLYKNDSLFHFTDAVVAFTLETPSSTHVFKRMPSTIATLDSRFVEILAEGKLTYIRDHRRELESVPVYGGAAEREMKDVSKSYLVQGKEWKAIFPSVSLLKSLTSDKASEMQSFLESARFNFKKDAGFAAGIQYYNSLFK